MRSAGRWPPSPASCEVHDLHVWEVTSGFPALSAHVVVRAEQRLPRASADALQRVLARSRSTSQHTTLQVDHEAAPQQPLQIEVAPRAQG